MKNLLWNVSALVIGLIVTLVGITLLQTGIQFLIPLPEGVRLEEFQDLESFLKVVPTGMMLLVEVSYILGAYCGGFAIGKISVSYQTTLAVILGALMMCANTVNIMMIPHPLWMIVLTTVTFIPSTLAGLYTARLGGRKK